MPGSPPVGTAPLPAELSFELSLELLDVFVFAVGLCPLAGGVLETTAVEWLGTFEVVGTVTTGAAETGAAVVVTGAWLGTVLWISARL